MANDYRTIFNAATGEETKVYLTDEEQAALVIERTANMQLLTARDIQQTAVQADRAELLDTKAAAAITLLQGDLDTINAANPVTNAMIVTAVKDMLRVLIVIVKVIRHQV